MGVYRDIRGIPAIGDTNAERRDVPPSSSVYCLQNWRDDKQQAIDTVIYWMKLFLTPFNLILDKN